MTDGVEQLEQVDPQVEAAARREGWKPLEEYEGPQDAWVDAPTFVKRGQEINPILRKNNERLQRELSTLRNELEESKKSIQGLQEYHKNLTQKAYERALKQAKNELRAARREGNLDAVDSLEEQIESLQENPPEELKPPKQETPPQAKNPMDDPVFRQWTEENPWVTSPEDVEMQDYANAVGMRLRKNNPALIGRPFLDEVTTAVRKVFPDKFGSPRSRHSMVEGNTPPSGGVPGGKGKRTITSLPAEAQAAYRDLSKEKWYQDLAKSQKLTPEQLYLQDYQE